MKIAVPVTKGNQIDEHFGHCEFFSIFTIDEDKRITRIQTNNSPQGCGCKSNISSIMADEGVSVMLAGGIGTGPINLLNSQGIYVIRGCSGNAIDPVSAYLEGKLSDSGSSCVQHDDHHGRGNHQHLCYH